ncbi:hypothetical protein [Streptomyces sp. TLI_185]|uniref:hypothetical protein n=1 Tax=Streptomyces sp. TLI_185 TaxID=2485151 RepID=UPI0021A4C020|nr:hypothetical protein [Streptomyces sp. TLI_185]
MPRSLRRSGVDAHRGAADGLAQVKVHQVLIEEPGTDERYDVIVSGLPLTDFSPVEVERIMARYLELQGPLVAGDQPMPPSAGARR